MNAKKITDRTIAKLERSAMLKLDADERDQVKADLEQMLVYVNQLQELDTADVELEGHPYAEGNAFREDRVVKANLAEVLKDIAPEGADGWYMVPAAIAESEERQPDGEM